MIKKRCLEIGRFAERVFQNKTGIFTVLCAGSSTPLVVADHGIFHLTLKVQTVCSA